MNEAAISAVQRWLNPDALAEIIVSGQIDTKLELYFLPFFGFNSIEEIPVPPSA